MIIVSDPINQFLEWMGTKWYISQVSSLENSHGAFFADAVEFQPSSQAPWGTVTSIDLNTDTATGVTSDGQTFTITHQGNQLTCQIDSQSSGRLVKNVVLGATSGIAVAAGVEIALRLPASTFFVTLLAAVTASLVATFASQNNPAQRGASATWIANDGGAGLVAESRTLRVMSA
jgi:hypothetical protein